MGRERQFDERAVLDAAADVFSVHGYHGTSLAMLLGATGVGKQSLYNSFGDKRALYLKALDCAAARFSAVRAEMRTAPSGRAAIDRFFARLLDQCTGDDPAARCCAVSAGLLEGIDDAAIHASLEEKWRATHEVLRAAVEQGQADGSIANRAASVELADLLMSVMSGLRVSARAEVAAERLRTTVGFGLSVLDRE